MSHRTQANSLSRRFQTTLLWITSAAWLGAAAVHGQTNADSPEAGTWNWFSTSDSDYTKSEEQRPREGTVLTNAAQIRSLTAEEAGRNYRVELRGTIVAEPANSDRLVLVDVTAGIYVHGPAARTNDLRRGDLVEIGGVTDPGEFAPFVSVIRVRKLGTGVIPPPRPVSFEQLISGGFDAQWVEVFGVVRRCEALDAGQNTMLDVATGGGRLAVKVIGRLNPEKLVDSEVRLPGVSFYQVNRSRQVISPLLVVPGGTEFAIEKPAPENPYRTPLLTSGSLLRFAPQGAYGHRVHLRGTVIHQVPGEMLWIRDASGGLRIETIHAGNVRPGDQVQVLGFPARGKYTPMLEDSVFRKVGSGPEPEPVVLATNISGAVNHDANLVQLSATLTGKELATEGWALLLKTGETMFRALLRHPAQQPLPESWLPGSRVQLTGIVAVRSDASSEITGVAQPHTSEILLRSIDDLRVIQPPPWWTWERTVWLLGGIACALILTIAAVIWAAKKRLREQAVQRALAEAEFAAILSERNRMAREIHDTLAQGLSAISMQLELAKSSLPASQESACRSVEQAHQLVRDSLAEARNSIWNMRSQVLETKNLPLAISGILQQLTSGTPIQGRFQSTGALRRLPPVTENNLLRIGQEAITNAVTHARASHIDVKLEFLPKEIRLSVADDGHGFDTENPPRSESGFGLRGMRERAAELGGTLLVKSRPGAGTALTLSVPAVPQHLH